MRKITILYPLSFFFLSIHLQAADWKENIAPFNTIDSNKLVLSKEFLDCGEKGEYLPQKEYRHDYELFEKDINFLKQPYAKIFLFKVIGRDKRYFLNHYLCITPEIINPNFLTVLSLRTCGLRDNHIKELHLFSHLINLDLRGNCVTDSGLEPILSLPKLEWLDLSSNYITNKGVLLLAGIESLTYLGLSLNEKISDEGVEPLLEHRNLKKLSIKFNDITCEMYERLKERIEEVDYFSAKRRYFRFN